MDIDGQDAFDRVFERAIELAGEVERQRRDLHEKDAEIAELKRVGKASKQGFDAANLTAREAETDARRIKDAAAAVVKDPTNTDAVIALGRLLEPVPAIRIDKDDEIPF